MEDEFKYLKQEVARLRYMIKNKPDLKLKTDCVIKMFGNEFDIRKMNEFDLRMMIKLLDLVDYPSMKIGDFTVKEYADDILIIKEKRDLEYYKNELKRLEDELKLKQCEKENKIKERRKHEDLSRLLGF